MNVVAHGISGIATRHYEEFKSSAISDLLIELNFQTMADPLEVSQLLNRNNHSKFKAGKTSLAPGWGVKGVDPRTEESWGTGAQFKPDTPVTDSRGRTRKYESPSGFDSAPLFLDPGLEGFWPGAIDNAACPVVITEGAKKAAALLSLGVAAISLPGVANGQKLGRLHELLELFACPARQFYLCFDNDWKTNDQVAFAMDTLGSLLAVNGSTVSVMQIPDGPAKGIDDFIAAESNDAAMALIDNALSWGEWRKAVVDQKRRRITRRVVGHEISPSKAFELAFELAQDDIPGSELHEKLVSISRQSGIPTREIEGYYAKALWERQVHEDSVEAQAGFERLLQGASFDPMYTLPPELGAAIAASSRFDRIDPIRHMQTLLPLIGTSVGGRFKVRTRRMSTAEDSSYVELVFFCGDVSRPSSGKTFASKRMAKPLEKRQQADDERLMSLQKEYKRAVHAAAMSKDTADQDEVLRLEEEIEEASRQRIFRMGGLEAISRKMGKQAPGAGTCIMFDELARLFCLDQYKAGGRGDSIKLLMEFWNGASWGRVNFADVNREYFLRGQTLNVSGGLQPAIMHKLFDGSDPDGLLSRLLLVQPDIPDDFWGEFSEGESNFSAVMAGLYEWLESVPETESDFSPDAAKLYKKKTGDAMRAARTHIDTNDALSQFLCKCHIHIARLAGGLHLMDCYFDKTGARKLDRIELDTVERAVDLFRIYIAHFRKIQATFLPPEENISGLQLRVYEYLKLNPKKDVTAYQLSRAWQRQKIKTDVVREALERLAEAGYAEARPDGKSYRWRDSSQDKRVPKERIVPAPVVAETVVATVETAIEPEVVAADPVQAAVEEAELEVSPMASIAEVAPDDNVVEIFDATGDAPHALVGETVSYKPDNVPPGDGEVKEYLSKAGDATLYEIPFQGDVQDVRELMIGGREVQIAEIAVDSPDNIVARVPIHWLELGS